MNTCLAAEIRAGVHDNTDTRTIEVTIHNDNHEIIVHTDAEHTDGETDYDALYTSIILDEDYTIIDGDPDTLAEMITEGDYDFAW